MKIKKLFVLLSLCLCASVITSCTRAIVFQVFNNTASDLEIISYESNQKEKKYFIAKNQSERVQVSNRLAIMLGTNVWEYDVKVIPKTTTYMISESFGPLVVKLQIEKDGGIYILPPESNRVTTNLPTQPPGYPLHPK